MKSEPNNTAGLRPPSGGGSGVRTPETVLILQTVTPHAPRAGEATVDMTHMIEQLCDYDHPLAEPALVVMHALTGAGLVDVRDDLFDTVISIMDSAEGGGVRILTEGHDVAPGRLEVEISGWTDQGDGSSRAPQEMVDDLRRTIIKEQFRSMKKALRRECEGRTIIGLEAVEIGDAEKLIHRIRKANASGDTMRGAVLFGFYMGMLRAGSTVDHIASIKAPKHI